MNPRNTEPMAFPKSYYIYDHLERQSTKCEIPTVTALNIKSHKNGKKKSEESGPNLNTQYF